MWQGNVQVALSPLTQPVHVGTLGYFREICQASHLSTCIARCPSHTQEYGPGYKSFGGSRPFVFVASPELVSQVLLTNTYRPVFPSIWLGKEREFDKANILVSS